MIWWREKEREKGGEWNLGEGEFALLALGVMDAAALLLTKGHAA